MSATLIEHPETAAKPTAGRRSLVLAPVDWNTYSKFARLFEAHPGHRLAYDHGVLEIMAPSMGHEGDSRFLGDLAFLATLILKLPLRRGGSTTMRQRLKERGIEPDECFWIQNARRVRRNRGNLDLRRDPPPDLAIEVDVTSSSLDRLAIYADFRVPEVWRLNGDEFFIYLLDDEGRSVESTTSRAMPLLTAADLLRFVNDARHADDENAVVESFQEWLRTRAAATEESD